MVGSSPGFGPTLWWPAPDTLVCSHLSTLNSCSQPISFLGETGPQKQLGSVHTEKFDRHIAINASFYLGQNWEDKCILAPVFTWLALCPSSSSEETGWLHAIPSWLEQPSWAGAAQPVPVSLNMAFPKPWVLLKWQQTAMGKPENLMPFQGFTSYSAPSQSTK